MSAKPLRIKFDKIDGFIKICNRVRHLKVFDFWLYDEI